MPPPVFGLQMSQLASAHIFRCHLAYVSICIDKDPSLANEIMADHISDKVISASAQPTLPRKSYYPIIRRPKVAALFSRD